MLIGVRTGLRPARPFRCTVTEVVPTVSVIQLILLAFFTEELPGAAAAAPAGMGGSISATAAAATGTGDTLTAAAVPAGMRVRTRQ